MIRRVGIEKSKLFFDQVSICEYIQEEALRLNDELNLGLAHFADDSPNKSSKKLK